MSARHDTPVSSPDARWRPRCRRWCRWRGLSTPWSERQFREELAREDRRWLAAEADGRVVGYGGVMLVGDECHLMDIAVERGFRDAGIARSLVWALAAEAERAERCA